MVFSLIDTHAHLDDQQFAADLPAVLTRAREAGLERVVTVSITAASTRANLTLADRFPELSTTVGIHPNNAVHAEPTDWDSVTAQIDHPGVVGVGETGLDRHWDTTPFALQEDYFDRHLQLSRQSGKPVVIHCREAEEDVVRMLRDEYDRHGPLVGVMHSFVGGQDTAEACLSMGLYLSFAGMLTYKNAASVREVASRVPKDRLLVETDCPYLSPVPLRGRRNEPAHVIHTARCLAELQGLTLEELGELTTRNARTLFALPTS